MGHYANECDKDETMKTSNKKKYNFLVLNKDHDSSSEQMWLYSSLMLRGDVEHVLINTVDKNKKYT